MFIINVSYVLGFIVTSFKYLIENCLVCKILVIYLEIDLSEKLNLILKYILIKASYSDNQDNILYKAFYHKFINIFSNKSFLSTNCEDKLWNFNQKSQHLANGRLKKLFYKSIV